MEKNNENEVFCEELNDQKLFSGSDENMGYKELSHNYLEIYWRSTTWGPSSKKLG